MKEKEKAGRGWSRKRWCFLACPHLPASGVVSLGLLTTGWAAQHWKKYWSCKFRSHKRPLTAGTCPRRGGGPHHTQPRLDTSTRGQTTGRQDRTRTRRQSEWWRLRPWGTRGTSSGRAAAPCPPSGNSPSHRCLSSSQNLWGGERAWGYPGWALRGRSRENSDGSAKACARGRAKLPSDEAETLRVGESHDKQMPRYLCL